LLYGAHFVTRSVCQVRFGAPRVRYVTPPARAAAVETICGGFGGGGGVVRPKRRVGYSFPGFVRGTERGPSAFCKPPGPPTFAPTLPTRPTADGRLCGV